MANELIDITSKPSGTQPKFVVTGFFTPNYRERAETFARSLAAASIPYHLFAVEKGSHTWRDIVHMKPGIVMRALDTYPGIPVVLMDVDSHVKGPIDAMLDFEGHISARAKMRLTRAVWPFHAKTTIHISSRSMVFKPHPRVRQFLEDWQHELRTATYHQGGCEMAMRFVMMRSVGLAFVPMDLRYSGMEHDAAPADAVVVHQSASRELGRA